MALTLTNLDSETRSFITQEILADIAAGKLYISARLSLPEYKVTLKSSSWPLNNMTILGLQLNSRGSLTLRKTETSKAR
ncbi:hypothetical protein A2G06_05555 [Geobacter anodireducens]|nr:hypothetical protein A2G06_05555 [Geobacter anodireducens]